MLDGQLSIFDLNIPKEKLYIIKSNIKISETLEKIQNEINEQDKKILNKYLDKSSKIIKTKEGRFILQLENEVIHLMKNGSLDFKTGKFPTIAPGDRILKVIEDIEPTEIQKEILSKFCVENNFEKVIKRKGDKNFIVVDNNEAITINEKGWILNFKQKAVYLEEEIISQKDIKINDMVKVDYKGIKYKGKVSYIYNNNCTINVIFDNKHTAFFKDNIKRIC